VFLNHSVHHFLLISTSAANNDWRLPQTIPSEPLHTALTKPYGFLSSHSGYFTHVGSFANEVNELGPDAETLPPAERRRRRLEHEEAKFDPEHYMADFAEDEYIKELIHWKHPYSSPSPETDSFEYTEEEKLTMLRLPRKEYLFSPTDPHDLQMTLLTVLFGYAYDARTTQLDPTPESPWTVASLVPAFAALDPAPYTPAPAQPSIIEESKSESDTAAAALDRDVTQTLAASYRRALAYPLFRSWALCEVVRSDVSALLSQGKRTLVRCLLNLKKILDGHDTYYVYSKVWVDDMLVWVMAHLRSVSSLF
jgi:protein SHQ1